MPGQTLPPTGPRTADRAKIVAFCIGFCTLQGSVTASGPASRSVQTAPKSNTLNEKFSFRVGSCTLQGSETASGHAYRARRNRRFRHRVLHASRKRNSLRTCVRSASTSCQNSFCIGFCTLQGSGTPCGPTLTSPCSPPEALRSIETVSARGARKSAVFAALFRAPCPQVQHTTSQQPSNCCQKSNPAHYH